MYVMVGIYVKISKVYYHETVSRQQSMRCVRVAQNLFFFGACSHLPLINTSVYMMKTRARERARVITKTKDNEKTNKARAWRIFA